MNTVRPGEESSTDLKGMGDVEESVGNAVQLSGAMKCESAFKGKTASTVFYVADHDINHPVLGWMDMSNVLEPKIQSLRKRGPSAFCKLSSTVSTYINGIRYQKTEESIGNSLISAEDVKGAILQQTLKFIQCKWPSFSPKGDLLELCCRSQVIASTRAVRTRMKPSRLQGDLFSNIYG
ncbi:unnamed protein product [Hymenolepis diminuta]|uniref:Uncharacterized protein n=1 Tax=Hymenolepis diminuta TaxID=6216 RepID=A0A3P6YJQ2_HYMDI|nr:unnamed protein product [Hymenolepis diminuta]